MPYNSLAHRTTWLRSDFAVLLGGARTLTLRRLDDGTGAPDTAAAISPDGRRIAGNAASAGAGGTAPVLWRCAA
ncbi:hypothetical protein GCM10009557_92900 [Virgisporangium ochraceum]